MGEKRFTLTDWHEVKDNGKIMTVDEVVGVLNSLYEENEQLRTRLEDVLAELYCKDRKLEELGISIECCDTDE